MRLGQTRDPSGDIGGEGCGAAGRHVDMDADRFARRRNEVVFGVDQRLEGVQPLGVMVEILRVDRNRVARLQLAEVGDMGFEGEHRGVAGGAIVAADAERGEELVERPVEEDMIIGQIEMAVIVDPGGLDGHDGRADGRGGESFAGRAVCVMKALAHIRHFATVLSEGRDEGGCKDHMTVQVAVEAVARNDAGIAAALPILHQRFGDRFVLSAAIRHQHGHTTTWLATQPPDAVVFPETREEAVEVVRICADHRVPIIPYGVGTSLEGHVNAPGGGVCVDMSRMNRVIAVHAEDLDCVVEPGVTRKHLNEYLRDLGLFFPIDPGADATLGGMAATRASGTNAVRYGTMRENVINLTVVMPDASVVKTARRAKKSSAGYDLTRLIVGSEGTLGLIIELTLRLHGIPEAIASGVCAFPTVEDACNATILTIQSGIPVARIELLDALQVKACNAYSKLALAETPTLFLEFHGSASSVKEQSEQFGAIARDFGGGEFAWATRPEERSRLWQARHDVYWSVFTLRPGAKAVSTDVCVPISRLAECVTLTAEDIARTGLVAPIVGHVGDGNFHLSIMVDMENPSEVERAEAFVGRLNRRAIAMDGTCTGEHGVGQGKMKYLIEEHGAGLDIMRAIKKTIDPWNIMNPGKIVALD
jgi:D-lactate dehydrogenase (cytochrome)